jgi:N-acetylgalactosamine kinase
MRRDDTLCEAFARRCGGRAAEGVARAPGRINLIGEHTDYNGLPVLPFALPHAIRIAFAANDSAEVELRHVRDTFSPVVFTAGASVPHDPPGSWGNYPRAAVEYLARLMLEKPGAHARGLTALVDGDIPQAGGLSSSSALVVAAALAFSEVNALALTPLALASHLAVAEKYVGTQGGGMDQAASLLGGADQALKIDFFPLSVAALPFPEGYAVLACHSLVRAAKTEDARAKFNRRVGECRVAAALLRRAYARPDAARLGDFAKTLGTAACLDALATALGGMDPVPTSRVLEMLDMCEEELTARFFRDQAPPPELKILSRARHVLEEAARVEAAARALGAGDMRALGALMTAAHASARDLYEISCPALDDLVRLFLEEGALGARLTGAGFGGFAIALGKEDALARIKDAVDARFYRVRAPELPRGDLRFVVRPADGARVVRC